MKHLSRLVLVVFATCIAGFVSQNSFAVDSLAEQFGIKMKGGGTFSIQAVSKENKVENKEGSSVGVYVFDLTLEKNFEHNGKVIVKFASGRGNGLNDKIDTYAAVNVVPDDTTGNTSSQTISKISKLYYQQSVFNDKLTIDFGKLNFSSFFAINKYSCDSDSQFITSVFTGDAIAETPPQRLGLVLSYNVFENLKVIYAYFAQDIDNLNSTGVNGVQFTYSPSESFNFLVYMWGNNKDHYSIKNLAEAVIRKSGILGFGISIDHEINKNIGFFGRFAFKDPSVSTPKAGVPLKVLDLNQLPCMSWDTGIQTSGNIWSRPADVAGFAIGQMFGSKSYENIYHFDYKAGIETEMELYYNFGINKNFTITPAVQYFINPKGGNALVKDNMFVAGVRMRMNF